MKEKAPKAAVSAVKDLFGGVKKTKEQSNKLVEDHYRPENLELLVWEYISKK